MVKKHVIRDTGHESVHSLRELARGAAEEGGKVVVVQGPESRGSYENKELARAGIQIVKGRNSDHADRVHKDLAREAVDG